MKINLDRLCRLAGVDSSQGNLLSEASNRSLHDDPALRGDDEFRFGKNQLAEGDMDPAMDLMDEAEVDEDEMIEVDEKMLVQEIRRAKKMMAEARQRKISARKTKENLQEAQLRKMISEEIDAVFKDLNLTSGWVYGKKKPTNRHKGSVNTAFPGIGFKKNR